MVPDKLEKQYRVHVYDTGPDEKLTLFSLFDYLQDIASDHAVLLGYGREDLVKTRRFWVLSRMYAIINDFPRWGETVVIETWPKGTDKMFALRDYEVCTPDGRIMAAATSSWLILDQGTRRICRPETTLTGNNKELLKRDSLPRNAARLRPLNENRRILSRFRVRMSDLDVNLHTNNVKYIKWIVDSYSLGFVMNKIPYSVEINYLSESYLDDVILVLGSETDESDCTCDYTIQRQDDNTDLCRIKIAWKERT